MAYKSKVYAGKVDPVHKVVTDDALYLGEIEFSSLADGFVKTIRLYNKNARKHLYNPQFSFKGYTHICSEIGNKSKTGRGYTHYWYLWKMSKGAEMPVTWGSPGKILEDYMMFIPKRHVNDKDALKYVSRYMES